MSEPILDRIDTPRDLDRLTMEELNLLSREMREEIIHVVAKNGGHLAPNLGIIDLTIALHKVFNSPEDKIIFDVGHQSYPHKLLTGRRKRFGTLRQTNGLSGFTKSDESEHDPFGGGHAGTAISSAMGYAAARDLRKGQENVIAVVGDGALINGVSLEALNNVRSTCKRLIIVINDNKMSISKSIGAIPNYLNGLITGRNYNKFKAFARMSVGHLPSGSEIIESIRKLETSTKSFFVPGVLFEEMGLRYVGPIHGHQLPELIQTFERVKHFKRPVIVHVITEKGHGCEYAADAPEKFHGISSFDPDTGEVLKHSQKGPTFSASFGAALEQLAAEDPKILGLTAAMASGTGMTNFAARFPERFFDTGIAEEHMLVFAAGLAAAGYKPVVAVYATFLQRALDCVFHDICLQNLPVVICADRAGLVEDGPTHHGLYDTAFLLAMPHLSVLMPRNETELGMMIREAVRESGPAVIRYPRGNSDKAPDEALPAPLVRGKAEVLTEGGDLALWCLGREVYPGLRTAELIEARTGRRCTVVNVRYLKPFDAELLLEHARNMPVVTLEDNCMEGGLASTADQILIEAGHHGIMHFGWKAGVIVPHGALEDLRKAGGLLPEQLADTICGRFFA